MIIEQSLLFLDTALADCKAADQLYKSKFFSQSIFYLHQSIEKICKYYALRNSLLLPEELKVSLGHNSLKLFTKILKDHFLSLENYWDKSEDKSQFDFTPFFKQIQDEFQAFNLFKPKDLISLCSTEIESYISRLDSLDKIENLSSPLDYVLKNPDNLINGLISLGILSEEDLLNVEKNKLDKLKSELNKVLKLIPKYQMIVLKLILLTTLFSNNLNATRYPDLKMMKTPNQIFNKNLPIVSHIPKISKHLDSIICTFRGLNEIKI